MTTPAARGDGRRKGVQRRVRFRRGAWIALPIYIIAFFAPTAARADTYTVTSASDYYISITEPTLFIARTYMYSGSPDTHLWLYNANGDLVAANDDYFGLQSFLSYSVNEPGVYRLRAGVCCGDPERWYGNDYTLETNTALLTAVPESTTTTTTITIAPYLNSPARLVIERIGDRAVRLSWAAPEQGNVEVESYAVFWSTDSSEATQVASSTDTWITLQGLQEGTRYTLGVRAENATLGVFSTFSETATIEIPVPATTTTLPPPATTTTTTTVAPEITVAPPPETTPPQATTTVPNTTTSTTLAPATTTTTTSSVVPTTTTTTTTTTVASTTTTVFTPPSSSDAALSTIATADLSTVTEDQAKEIFNALDVSSLDNQEKQLLIEKIKDAPAEVRAAFEEEIDIFGEGLDDYVPLGSNIDVGTRRALIAVTAVTTTLTVSTGMTPPPTSAPTAPTPTSPNDSSSTGKEKSSRRRRK